MVFGDAAGAVSQLIQEHRYRPRTSHGVSLRLRRTRVKRSLGRETGNFPMRLRDASYLHRLFRESLRQPLEDGRVFTNRRSLSGPAATNGGVPLYAQ
jgi:hypothetical protein